jgi:hypothetical protein
MEYEMLAEYAHGDLVADIDFSDYTDMPPPAELFANCVNNEETDSPGEVVSSQIDMALDLLAISDALGDREWTEQLRARLAKLARRSVKLQGRAGKKASAD